MNKLTGLRREAALLHGPMITHKETWTLAQYIDVIGTDPRPGCLPEGFIRNETLSGEIAFRHDKRCDFNNTWRFSYEAQNGRKIMVFVNPNAIPYWASLRSHRLEDDRKPEELSARGKDSLISGSKVTLWHLEQGEGWDYGLGGYRLVTDYYCADFWYRDTGFTITAENGVEEEALIEVIKLILS